MKDVTSIKVNLVVDEKPNEVEAHDNDEGNEDTYDDDDDFFFSTLVKKCRTRRSTMISLSKIWSYMLIYEC
jgi:hypothetical protein